MKIDNLLPIIKDICEKRGLVYVTSTEASDNKPCYIMNPGKWVMIKNISKDVSDSIIDELDYLNSTGYNIDYGRSSRILIKGVWKDQEGCDIMIKLIPKKVQEGMSHIKSYKIFNSNTKK